MSLRVYLEGKVLEVLSLMAHAYENRRRQKPPSVRLTRSNRRWLAKAAAEMKRDLSAYPSIERLAAVANMSLSRFQLAFKWVYGTTSNAYRQDLRMNHALQLLHNPDLSIGEIAARVGYRHAGHFSGLFKQSYSLFPREYQTSLRLLIRLQQNGAADGDAGPVHHLKALLPEQRQALEEAPFGYVDDGLSKEYLAILAKGLAQSCQ